MEDEFEREIEPKRDLDPPSRKPPTAVGAATSGPAPERSRSVSMVRAKAAPNWLGTFVTRTLDVVDELGDLVAEALHLRSKRTP
jgi:hypothetical protein